MSIVDGQTDLTVGFQALYLAMLAAPVKSGSSRVLADLSPPKIQIRFLTKSFIFPATTRYSWTKRKLDTTGIEPATFHN